MSLRLLKIPFYLLLFCLFSVNCKTFTVEPEDQFVQIYFKYGKNILNTFEKTFQKDLVMDEVIKVEFWLTSEEQNNILKKINEVDYFSMPDTFKYVHEGDKICVSEGEFVFRIKTKKNDKLTYWTHCSTENKQLKDLQGLQWFIVQLINSKPEYKNLPPIKGRYM